MDELRMLVRLNEETQAHHAEADHDVDRFLFKPDVSAADYRRYLCRVYGFLVPLEASLATAPGIDEVIDVRVRAKSALVVHDLIALGMSMADVNDLPQCQTIPAFRGPAAALGWMYVSERPMLASAVLRGHLGTFLRAEVAYASSYFSAYAGQVGARWRELGEAMDRIAYTASVADLIVFSAHQAFRALQHFRTQELSLRSTLRIAG
jgi:heme oxygenase